MKEQGNFGGWEHFIPEFPQTFPKNVCATIFTSKDHGQLSLGWPWETNLHVIVEMLGAIIFKSKLGVILVRIFRELTLIFREFTKIFIDFPQICRDFQQIKTFRDAVAPVSLAPLGFATWTG